MKIPSNCLSFQLSIVYTRFILIMCFWKMCTLLFVKNHWIWLIYALLSRSFVVRIYALFPRIFLAWKTESANFFAFWVYDWHLCPYWHLCPNWRYVIIGVDLLIGTFALIGTNTLFVILLVETVANWKRSIFCCLWSVDICRIHTFVWLSNKSIKMDKRLPKAVQTYFYAKKYDFLSLVEIYIL